MSAASFLFFSLKCRKRQWTRIERKLLYKKIYEDLFYKNWLTHIHNK